MDNALTANGDYDLLLNGRAQVTNSESSTIMITENSASATLIFGFADEADGSFIPYPDGTFNDGKKINHGVGCKLMVRASGITSDSVTIRRFPG